MLQILLQAREIGCDKSYQESLKGTLLALSILGDLLQLTKSGIALVASLRVLEMFYLRLTPAL